MGDQTLATPRTVHLETVHAETAQTITGLLTKAEPVTVIVEGSKGSGKTTLAASVTRGLGDRFAVHAARGTAPGRSMALFAIEHLLTNGAGTIVEAAGNPAELLNRLTSTIAAHSGSALPMLWVDNLELLDPQSAALLAMLAGTQSIRILATCRSLDEVEAFRSLKAEGLLKRESVPVLLPEQSREVLESRLEGPATVGTVSSLHAFAGGNPLMLRLLVDHARENGMVHREQGRWNLSGHLIESMTAGSLSAGMRILASDLTPSELNAAEILAAAGDVRIDYLMTSTDGAVLEGMEHRGLITLGRGESGQTEAALTNEALGHIIRQTMSRTRAAEIWTETVRPDFAANPGSGAESMARPTAGQLLWAARLDLGVTDVQLTAAAEEALFAATPGVAERLLGHVNQETAHILRLHAEARYLLGDVKRAAKLIEAAVSTARADDDVRNHAFASVLALLLETGDEAPRTRTGTGTGTGTGTRAGTGTGAATGSGIADAPDFAALQTMITAMNSGRFRQVIETYDEARFDVVAGGVDGASAEVGRADPSDVPGTEVGGAVTAAGGTSAEISWFASVLCAEACAIVGEQERASEMIEEALAVQHDIRSAVLADRALRAWCRILFLAGHWETCRQVLQAEHQMRPARMLHSDGELEALEVIVTGRAGGSVDSLPRIGAGLDAFGTFISAAAEAAGAAETNPRAAGMTPSSAETSPSNAAEVHRALLDQLWIAEESGPQLFLAGSVVLHTMVTGGGDRDVYFGVPEQDLKNLLRLAGTNEEHLAARYGALATGLLDGDAATLLEAAHLGRMAGDELLAGKAAAAAASLAGSNRDRDTMREAQDVIGDPGLPTTHISGVLEELTKRERQVAALAVSGSSNADISAALGISVRTAERHLQNAYDKTGVSGRAELAAAMETEMVGACGA
ncbi:helix-turn-helix transcriptional regulator [Arthrobacter pigmenti]